MSVAPAESAATSTVFRRRSRAVHASRVDWLNPAWICMGAAFALSLLGIAVIATTQPALAARQSVFLGIAVIATAALAAPHYRWLQHFSLPLMIAVATSTSAT